MIVAITGGTGFIGAKLTHAHLGEGHEVRVLTRRPSPSLPAATRVVRGDLATGDIPSAFLSGADVLYHCAGELRDESRMHALHVEGTRHLRERAAGQVRRWVQLSSVGVYGPRRDGTVVEDADERPVGTYERTKAESDRLVREAGATLDTVIVRPSIVFGPDMPNQSLFALIGTVERGLFFFVGPRGASANYVPVDNVVDALMLCATSPRAAGGVFNVSATTTMEDFVGTIADALGCSQPRTRLPRAPLRGAAAMLRRLPGWPLSVSRIDALSTRVVYSTARIESDLGYRPRVTVDEALRATVARWRSRRAAA
jgi:nucleoside-diphosphate-sugar epimerase